MYRHCLTILLIAFGISFATGQITSSFRFSDGFDSLKVKDRWYFEITENNDFYPSLLRDSINSESGRLGSGFLISEMNSATADGIAKRTEVVTRLFDSIGMEKYYAVSIRIPESFKFEERNLGRETMVCQWHSRPAPGKTWDEYRDENKFERPSLAMYLTSNNNSNYYLLLRYGNHGRPGTDEFGNVWSVVALKEVNTNQWYDLVFHIRWSFKNDGYVSAWINNVPFTPFNGLHNMVYGANMHNESPVTYKMGQYRYFNDSNTHVINFDEFAVGDSFEEVSLYKNLPIEFQTMLELNFVENHK